MELYDRSAWTGNDKISGNASHAHKEVNSHFVHPWNAARQGKDRRGQIANRRSTVGGRWNEKNRPRRLFSCAPLVQGQPLRRLTPPAPLLPKGSLLDSATSQEVALSEPPFGIKGAHEGRRQWRKQAVVSPVRQGKPRVSLRTTRIDYAALWNGVTAQP